MPAAANQSPAPNQSSVLDTTRVKSTIPKAGSDDGSWVYPSPQMVRLIYVELSFSRISYVLCIKQKCSPPLYSTQRFVDNELKLDSLFSMNSFGTL